MTHAVAFQRRAPHIPPSDCPGELRPRRLRSRDTALRCTACGVAVWLDGAGAVVAAALNGSPLRIEAQDAH